ncbi:hypothetical protein [Streptosporangium sp. NPDC003464]
MEVAATTGSTARWLLPEGGGTVDMVQDLYVFLSDTARGAGDNGHPVSRRRTAKNCGHLASPFTPGRDHNVVSGTAAPARQWMAAEHTVTPGLRLHCGPAVSSAGCRVPAAGDDPLLVGTVLTIGYGRKLANAVRAGITV